MDQKSIEILEFPQIREIIARHTSFTPGREMAVNLTPLHDIELIKRLLRQSAEARRLLTIEPNFSIGGVYDIREATKLASLGKILETQTLLDIQQTISAFQALRQAIKRISGDFPLLWQICDGIVEIPEIVSDIEKCIAADGVVLDRASAALARIREQLRGSRLQLTARLQVIINSTRWQKVIQEPVITEREGRYVIPIKIDQRKEMKGIVHDVSNTGATVFVEPWSTVELGNTVRELVIEEQREIERILSSLSNRIGFYNTEIQRSTSLIAEFDLCLAKARYAAAAGAAEPQIVRFEDGPESYLKLVSARHPLLGKNAVPLDIELGREYSVLVITGPNTGGKTVAMKTIGIISMMAMAGLPVPASDRTCIPVFPNIFADIGDEQSIEQTLSTFSWHIGNIVRILNSAGSKCLVLMDELGTSTDPAEGSALARALLQYFLEHGTFAVATSHFSELKAFVHGKPGMQNASMNFDPATLAPTYHLTLGIPGGSNALATASRLGLRQEIINNARNMLSPTDAAMEKLLADLTTEKQDINSLQVQLRSEQLLLEKRNLELAQELEKLKTEERRAVMTAKDELIREAAELHKEIRAAVADLRKEKSQQRIEESRKALADVKEKLKAPNWQTTASTFVSSETITPGDVVLVKDSNLMATVVRVYEDSGQVQLQAGQTLLRVGMDSVEKQSTPENRRITDFNPVKIDVPRRKVPLELDLRGKRADEVETSIDEYLNDATVAGMPFVRIIHGMGTGVVKEIARNFLNRHPLVKSFRPGGKGEGGDGATVVNFKN